MPGLEVWASSPSRLAPGLGYCLPHALCGCEMQRHFVVLLLLLLLLHAEHAQHGGA